MPMVSRMATFSKDLASWRAPQQYLTPLGHHVSSTAPAGVVHGLARVSAPPVVQRAAVATMPAVRGERPHPQGRPTWRTVFDRRDSDRPTLTFAETSSAPPAAGSAGPAAPAPVQAVQTPAGTAAAAPGAPPALPPVVQRRLAPTAGTAVAARPLTVAARPDLPLKVLPTVSAPAPASTGVRAIPGPSATEPLPPTASLASSPAPVPDPTPERMSPEPAPGPTTTAPLVGGGTTDPRTSAAASAESTPDAPTRAAGATPPTRPAAPPTPGAPSVPVQRKAAGLPPLVTPPTPASSERPIVGKRRGLGAPLPTRPPTAGPMDPPTQSLPRGSDSGLRGPFGGVIRSDEVTAPAAPQDGPASLDLPVQRGAHSGGTGTPASTAPLIGQREPLVGEAAPTADTPDSSTRSPGTRSPGTPSPGTLSPGTPSPGTPSVAPLASRAGRSGPAPVTGPGTGGAPAGASPPMAVQRAASAGGKASGGTVSGVTAAGVTAAPPTPLRPLPPLHQGRADVLPDASAGAAAPGRPGAARPGSTRSPAPLASQRALVPHVQRRAAAASSASAASPAGFGGPGSPGGHGDMRGVTGREGGTAPWHGDGTNSWVGTAGGGFATAPAGHPAEALPTARLAEGSSRPLNGSALSVGARALGPAGARTVPVQRSGAGRPASPGLVAAPTSLPLVQRITSTQPTRSPAAGVAPGAAPAMSAPAPAPSPPGPAPTAVPVQRSFLGGLVDQASGLLGQVGGAASSAMGAAQDVGGALGGMTGADQGSNGGGAQAMLDELVRRVYPRISRQIRQDLRREREQFGINVDQRW
jgi:hypothetical protein